MSHIQVTRDQNIATITLARGKVNAIDHELLSELETLLPGLATDPEVHGVIITGQEKFFSFGLDVPNLYSYSPEQMTRFIQRFCSVYRELFLFPKPVVAAINGHAIAGGCILALACDHRIMVRDSARIGLNEVTFGASLFAGAVEMLRFAVGSANAQTILLTGKMFSAQEALQLDLVHELVTEAESARRAMQKAQELATHAGRNYTSLKGLVRRPVADAWNLREADSIREWIAIWYSPETREKIKGVQIRS